MKPNWSVLDLDLKDFKNTAVVDRDTNCVVCHVYLPENQITADTRSNAKLISASPDLLHATQDAITLLQSLNNSGYVPEEFKLQLAEFFINAGIAVQKATE